MLHAIENETDLPPGLPYYQKPPQTLKEQANTQARKSYKGVNLAVEKPEQIKLQALSDVVSDGPDSPRKISEFSSREENENSFEGDRKAEQGKNHQKHSEERIISPVNPQSQVSEKKHDGMISVEMIDLEGNNGDVKESQAEEMNKGQESEDSPKYESAKIDISIWEFILSFVKKTEKSKEKFEVLDKGMKNVRERMDILNIMKKFREFDKLKVLLLEEDQLVLFNAIPKAEIKANTTLVSADEAKNSKAFSGRILKKSTFIEIDEKQEQVRQSFDNIRLKAKKTKIDSRLLEIYNALFVNK